MKSFLHLRSQSGNYRIHYTFASTFFFVMYSLENWFPKYCCLQSVRFFDLKVLYKTIIDQILISVLYEENPALTTQHWALSQPEDPIPLFYNCERWNKTKWCILQNSIWMSSVHSCRSTSLSAKWEQSGLWYMIHIYSCISVMSSYWVIFYYHQEFTCLLPIVEA